MRTPSKRPGSLNKHKPKNKTEGNWDLPHPVELKQHQKDFLRSHYGPGINIESANPSAETKKIIKSSSPLTKNRFGHAEWLKSNYRLYEKALEGDEKSFQVLISRDPRYLCSDLGLLFISKWRSEINISYFTKRTKNALARLQSWIDKTGPENQWLFLNYAQN